MITSLTNQYIVMQFIYKLKKYIKDTTCAKNLKFSLFFMKTSVFSINGKRIKFLT